MLCELTETAALKIVLCGNSETVTDRREVRETDHNDITRECLIAAAIAMEKIHPTAYFADVSGNFTDWHGGRYYRHELGYGSCYVSAMKRDEGGAWSWINPAKVDDATRKAAMELADAANGAYARIIEAAEADYEADNTPANLARELEGLPYKSRNARAIMDRGDGSNIWPRVNADGEFTGEVVGDEPGLLNVDDIAMISRDDATTGGWTIDDGYASPPTA